MNRAALRIALVLAIACFPILIMEAQSTSTAAAASMPGAEILKLTTAGRHEEARIRALARLSSFKDDIDAYVSLSWSLVALGKYSEAETWATRGYAVRKDPRLAQAIGEASYYRGNNETAL